jgi:hypothetical protein
MDTIKSVEQNYKWIIYRLCCESYQNKYEIINTETADQNILDSDVISPWLHPPLWQCSQPHASLLADWWLVEREGSINMT